MSNLSTYISTLFSRWMLAKQAGLQYGGSRDLYGTLGYPNFINYKDCWNRYCRQDIAYAVISRQVDHTWKDGVGVYDKTDNESTEFDDVWSAIYESDNLKLIQKFKMVDTFAMLGQYSVLLLGLDDVVTDKEWEKEPQKGVRLLYLQSFNQEKAKISVLDSNPKSQRYGMPLIYEIEMAGTPIRVHCKRVIHVIHSDINDGVRGLYYLEKIYNRLMDLDKIVGGDAEMFWRGARPGYVGKVDKDYSVPKGFEDNLKEQIDEFEHNLRRILVNEGLDLEALAQQIADPVSHVDSQIDLIASATGIPKRILMGSERGELASSQDETQFNSFISQRRLTFAETCIVRPFVERLIELNVLPDVDYEVEWKDLFARTIDQVVDVGKKRADALASYVNTPGANAILPEKIFLETCLGYSEAEIELIQSELEQSVQKGEVQQLEEGVVEEGNDL